jgi:hypothetical protein
MDEGRKTAAALCYLILSVCFMPACTHSQRLQSQPEQPDLKETSEWINQTYNPRPGEISFKNRGVYEAQLRKNGIYVTVDRKTSSLRLDGCVATLEVKQEPNLQMSSEIVATETQTFNLADIDPTLIKVEQLASTSDAMICDKDPNLQLECDEAEIGLHTRNQKQAIKSHRVAEYPKLTGSDHMNVSDSMDDSAFVFVNDLAYLPRLVTALKRGIELCGGKPSSF